MGIFSRLRTLEDKSDILRVDLASHLYMGKIVSCGGVEFNVKAIKINKDDDILLCGGKAFEVFKGWRHLQDYPIKVLARNCKIIDNEKTVKELDIKVAKKVISDLVDCFDSLLKSSNNINDIDSFICVKNAKEFLDSE